MCELGTGSSNLDEVCPIFNFKVVPPVSNNNNGQDAKEMTKSTSFGSCSSADSERNYYSSSGDDRSPRSSLSGGETTPRSSASAENTPRNSVSEVTPRNSVEINTDQVFLHGQQVASNARPRDSVELLQDVEAELKSSKTEMGDQLKIVYEEDL